MRIRTSLVAVLMAVAACGPAVPVQYTDATPQDPCSASYFTEVACQQAVAAGGYYYMGAFVPHVYINPYSYYYGGYTTYRRGGGVVHVVSPTYYSRTYVGGGRTVVTGGVGVRSTVPTTTVYSSGARTTTVSPRVGVTSTARAPVRRVVTPRSRR